MSWCVDYYATLQIDFDALMLMREDDFDKLNVSFGHRVKLRNLQRCEYGWSFGVSLCVQT